MSDLPFGIRTRVGKGDLVTFVAEREGEQLAIVRYMIGNLAKRGTTADALSRNEKLCGKLTAKKRQKVRQAIEAALEDAELRARKKLDEQAEADSQTEMDEFLDALEDQEKSKAASTRRQEPPIYRETPSGLVWIKPTPNGEVEVRLTNFTAMIVSDVVRDDGAETTRFLEIEAFVFERAPRRFTVAVNRFAGMNWAVEELGPQALVYPGVSVKDHTRAAIQVLSRHILRRTIYTHTGWRRIGDQWHYLHGGGAIGPNGPVADVEVSLPESLAAFRLPAPPEGDKLKVAIRASLDILTLGPLRVTAPVLAAGYRSILDVADCNVSLFGHTGVFKTELAALAMQHFGANFNSRKLPASWSSTGNALEALAFMVKDAILVIDDFAPGGSSMDVARYHREADRVLRAQGNNSGRARLRPDGEPRPIKRPRGLILTTGEEVPRGESLRARQLIIEVKQNDIAPVLLTEAQAAGAAGLFAEAMSGFLLWIARRLDILRVELRQTVTRLRAEVNSFPHRRTLDVVAHLAFGLRTFLDFALESGAISQAEKDQHYTLALGAMLELAAEQQDYLHAADPARRYLELIRAAIVAGDAHLRSPDGVEPENPTRWGWTASEQEGYGLKHRASGDCIGWIDDDAVYLEPTAAYRVAQKMAAASDGLSIADRTLRKRLADGGWLATTDRARKKLVVRRVLQGERREVLHLSATRIMKDEPAQTAQEALGTDAHDKPEEVSGLDGPVGPVPEA